MVYKNCNWCNKLYFKEKFGHNYCSECEFYCERECKRCHKPYPKSMISKSFQLDEKLCNSCFKTKTKLSHQDTVPVITTTKVKVEEAIGKEMPKNDPATEQMATFQDVATESSGEEHNDAEIDQKVPNLDNDDSESDNSDYNQDQAEDSKIEKISQKLEKKKITEETVELMDDLLEEYKKPKTKKKKQSTAIDRASSPIPPKKRQKRKTTSKEMKEEELKSVFQEVTNAFFIFKQKQRKLYPNEKGPIQVQLTFDDN